MTKKSMLTPHAVAWAAQRTLRDEALLPPRSADEIEALEEEFGVYPAPTMSASMALKMAVGKHDLPQVAPKAIFGPLGGQIQEELGMAARKGKEIPPAMWDKMKSDRKQAENERARAKK